MAQDFHTGIQSLDRELPHGIPPGSLLLVKAQPDTQSELLLQSFANDSPSIYITTMRSKDAVEEQFENADFLSKKPEVYGVDQSSPLDELKEHLASFPEDCYIIIDSIDIIERQDKVRYQKFLTKLQEHMLKTDSVAILHGYKYDAEEPENRTITEGISDIIFNLVFEENSGEIETKLIVSKFRGGKALDEVVKIKLTDTVDVDTSHEI